jgi:hypothetical protein
VKVVGIHWLSYRFNAKLVGLAVGAARLDSAAQRVQMSLGEERESHDWRSIARAVPEIRDFYVRPGDEKHCHCFST